MKLKYSKEIKNLEEDNFNISEAFNNKSAQVQPIEKDKNLLIEEKNELLNKLERCGFVKSQELIKAQKESIRCLKDLQETKQDSDLLKKENKQLKRLNADARSQIKTYELHLADGRNVINSLKQDIEDLTAKNICVTREMARLQKQKEEFETEIKYIRELEKVSEPQEEALKFDIQNLKQELYKSQNKNHGIKNQLEVIELELENTKTTLVAMQAKMDRLIISEDYARSEVIILKQKNEESVNELQQLRLDAVTAEQKKNNLTKALRDLNVEMQESKAKHAECYSQLMSCKTDVCDLQERANLLENENEALKVNENRFQQEAEFLRRRNQEYKTELDQICKTNGCLEKEKDDLTAVNKKQLKELAEYRNKHLKTSSDMNFCSMELSNVQQKLHLLQKENESLKINENRVQEEAARLKQKTQDYEAELNCLNEANKEMNDKEEELMAMNHELKQTLEESNKKHLVIVSELAVCKAELCKSKQTVDLLQKENEELQVNENHAKQEAACLQRKNHQYGIELEQMRKTNACLEKEKEDLNVVSKEQLEELTEYENQFWNSNSLLTTHKKELSISKQTADLLQNAVDEIKKSNRNHKNRELLAKLQNQLDDLKKETEGETLQKYREPELDLEHGEEEVTPRSRAHKYNKRTVETRRCQKYFQKKGPRQEENYSPFEL